MIAAALSAVLVLAAAKAASKAVDADARRRTIERLVPAAADVGAETAAPAVFVRWMRRAGVDQPTPARLWRAWTVGGCLAVLAAAAFGGLALAAALALGLLVVPPMVLWSLRGRGDDRYQTSVPALLDDVASALRAGSSVLIALRSAALRIGGPVGRDVTALVEAVEHGGSFVAEIDRWVANRRLDSVRLAGAALAVGATAGGRQAHALEAVSVTLRERAEVRAEAVGLAAQSRSAAAVMAVLPVVFAIFAGSFDSGMGHLLLRTPVGLACLLAGLALDGGAALWMARITGSVR